MEIELTGRNAVVTGGASGIGKECALLLAECGAQVAVVDINLEGAQQAVAAMGNGFAVRCDLGDPDDVSAMRREVLTRMGGVDILINSGGIISYRQGIGAVPVEEWDRVLDVNLRGTYLVCREFIAGMKERRGGRIVMFSSLAARAGGIEAGIHYSASKAGLIGLTRTLAKEGGPFGITVNAIAPGFITTEPVRRQIQGHEEQLIAQVPLRRLGQPRDVANVVLFLVSPLADYVTGVVLDINGGQYMG